MPAEANDAGYVAAVDADLKTVQLVHFPEKGLHPGIRHGKHILLRPLSGRLVKKENDGVDSLGESIVLKTLDGLVYCVFAKNIMNIGLHSRVEKHLNGPERIIASVPAHGNRPAVAFADSGDLWRHPIAGGGEIGNNIIFTTDPQKLLKVFVLIWVAASAERKLIAAMSALFCDPAKIFQRHIRPLNQQTTLVASDPRFYAQAGTAMDAVPHHADVDQVWKLSHKWVLPAVFSFFIQNTCSHICAGFRIEIGHKMIFLISDPVFHVSNLSVWFHRRHHRSA